MTDRLERAGDGLGWLRRAWDDLQVPRWGSATERADAGTVRAVALLRRAYRGVEPARPFLPPPRLRPTRRPHVPGWAALLVAALGTWTLFSPRGAVAPSATAPDRRPAARVVRADAERTEILSGRVRLILLRPSPEASPTDSNR